MIAMGILGPKDFLAAAQSAGGPLALLFGGMVVAHVLEKTGLFEHVGDRCCAPPADSGKRLLPADPGRDWSPWSVRSCPTPRR